MSIGCQRSGMCCKVLHIPPSPRELRDNFRAWRDQAPGITIMQDIWMLFPMLEGRCLGKRDVGYGMRFYYGPCKMLGVMADGKQGCTIQADKPKMCSGYPFYATPEIERPTNPGIMKGCGFNADAAYGVTPEQMSSGLLPLEENEK